MESRSSSVRLSRDAALVRDEFDRHVSPLSNSVTFGRTSASDHAYAALLISELRGSISNVRADREALGRSLMITDPQPLHEATEAIRSFRRARSDKALQSALTWIRNEGPSEALVDEASHIISNAQVRVSIESLKVLEYSAEFLDKASLEEGIDFALSGSWGGPSRVASSWSEEAAQWKTISRLLPGSGADTVVAQRVLSRLGDREAPASPTVDQLRDVVSALQWSSVHQDTRLSLSRWADQHSADEYFEVVAQSILANEGREASARPGSLEAAVALVNADQESTDDEAITEAVGILIDHLSAERSQAANGVRSFGGLDTLEAAVAFALRYPLADLWSAIADAVSDENLRSDQTAAAFDRMSLNPDRVPTSVREALATAWQPLLSRDETAFGFRPQTSINAALIRATTALGINHPADALTAALQLSSESESGQIEATKLLTLCRIDPDSTAVHSLLLQLSRAENAQVRAEAGYGLTVTSNQASSIRSLVQTRIEELAQADGVRVPLRVMHGAQFLSQRDGKASSFLLGLATRTSETARARVVRGAASKVLEMNTR